jgi:hypothetical protein
MRGGEEGTVAVAKGREHRQEVEPLPLCPSLIRRRGRSQEGVALEVARRRGPPWRSCAGEDCQGGAQEGAAIIDVLLHRLADVEVLEEAETGCAALLHLPVTPPYQIRTSEA